MLASHITAELRPCPFCGGGAKFFVRSHMERGMTRGYTFGIFCTKCDVTTPKTDYVIEFHMNGDGEIEMMIDERLLAIEAWNRRVDDG